MSKEDRRGTTWGVWEAICFACMSVMWGEDGTGAKKVIILFMYNGEPYEAYEASVGTCEKCGNKAVYWIDECPFWSHDSYSDIPTGDDQEELFVINL